MPQLADNRQRGAAATEPPLPPSVPTVLPVGGAVAHPAAPAAAGTVLQTNAANTANTPGLVVREGAVEEPAAEPEGDTRLDRIPMQLDVLVKVRSFRVRDLLSLEKGSVVETVHEHTQDVPVRCGGAPLVWAEFEVLDQVLAVRITRLG